MVKFPRGEVVSVFVSHAQMHVGTFKFLLGVRLCEWSLRYVGVRLYHALCMWYGCIRLFGSRLRRMYARAG